MIFLQFWWAVLVFNSLGSNSWPMNGDPQIADQMASEQLQSFSQAVDDAGPELQDLWSSFGELPEEFDSEMEHPRNRRSAIDSSLTDFEQSPAKGSMGVANLDKDTRNWQAEADAWYENFQMQMAKKEAARKRMIHKQEQSLTDSVTEEDMRVLGPQADAWYRDFMANKSADRQKRKERFSKKEQNHQDQIVKRTETGKAKQKKFSDEAQKNMDTQSRYQGKAHGALFQDDVKLKQTPQVNLKAQSWMKVKDEAEKFDKQMEKLQESRDVPLPDAVYDSNSGHQDYPPTKSNKLDHEANYKLSKIEQEAAEKMPKQPRALGQNIHHFKQKKRRSPGVCDPMEEIKLKTSSRLIAKGFGPLLPSETYELSRKGKLEDWQTRMFDATQDKYQRLKNLDQQAENIDYVLSKTGSAMDAVLPESLDDKNPENYRLYSYDQQKKPTVLDYDRTKRKPKGLNSQSEPSLRTYSHDVQESSLKQMSEGTNQNLATWSGMNSQSEPSLRTYSHDDQESSLKQPVGEPSPLKDQMKANLYEEEQLRAQQPWMAYNPKLSDDKKATVTREHEAKEMVQKLQKEHREDTKLQDAALAKPVSYVQHEPAAPLKRNVEEKLNADLKAVAPTVNMNAEATSNLHDYQEARAHRVPRHTRRVKRSLGEQHVAARRRAQMLDKDFEDHNGNRVSLGDMGNGLLTPDAEELDGGYLSIKDQELLAYKAQKVKSHHDPMENFVNQRPNSMYHYHEPHLGHSHENNFKAYTNFSNMSDLQKYIQLQQDIMEDFFDVFLKNEDLLNSTKFKPKTQVARMLLHQYHSLPLMDQLIATDRLVQDLADLLHMAENEVHQQRDTLIYEILDDVFEEYKKTKPASWLLNYIKVAELLRGEGEHQSLDPLAFS